MLRRLPGFDAHRGSLGGSLVVEVVFHDPGVVKDNGRRKSSFGKDPGFSGIIPSSWAAGCLGDKNGRDGVVAGIAFGI